MDFQGTLFEPAVDAPGLGGLEKAVRHTLTRGAWVDVRRDWVSGADGVLERHGDPSTVPGPRRPCTLTDGPRLDLVRTVRLSESVEDGMTGGRRRVG